MLKCRRTLLIGSIDGWGKDAIIASIQCVVIPTHRKDAKYCVSTMHRGDAMNRGDVETQ